MSKKIAIQLFGHLRTFDHAFKYFEKYVLEPNKKSGYEIDIFIHTWNERDHSTINYRNPNGEKPSDAALTKADQEKVLALYKPKSILFENQIECEDKIIIEKIANVKRSIKGCINNSYTIFKVNELRQKYEKENNIKYDWVIQTRPDILFKSPFDIDLLLEPYQRFSFDVPQNAFFYASNPFNRGMVLDPRLICGSDLIYFSAPNKATALYQNFDKNIDINNFYCFEVWWMEFWKKQNLKPIMINYLFGRDADVLYANSLHILDTVNLPVNKEKTTTKIRLLGISLLKIKKQENKIKIYFLGLPIIKIKTSDFKTKIYLCALPLLKISRNQ